MTASPLPADPSEVARLSDVARLAEIARLGLDREVQSQHLRGIVDDVAAHLDQPWVSITIFLVAFLQEKAAEALVWLSPVWLSGPTPA